MAALCPGLDDQAAVRADGQDAEGAGLGHGLYWVRTVLRPIHSRPFAQPATREPWADQSGSREAGLSLIHI